MSTAESEYVALSQAAQEAVWVRRLLEEIGMDLTQNPTLIHEDNQGAIAIARNPVAHARTKHIDIRYHFVREAILKALLHCAIFSATCLAMPLRDKLLENCTV